MPRVLQLANSSVRARVLLPTAVLFTLTLGAATVVLVKLYGQHLEREDRNTAQLAASVIEANIRHELAQTGPTHLPALLSSWTHDQSLVRSINVVRPDGIVAFSSDESLIGTRLWPEPARYLPLDGTRRLHSEGQREVAIVAPLHVDARCVSCHPFDAPVAGYLDARFGETAFHEHTPSLMLAALTVTVPALLILLGIAWWLQTTQVVRPLARLRTAMRVARHVQDVRADDSRPDELGEVARSFNHTLQALNSANAELEAFYRERAQQVERFAAMGELAAGMAHELKNPLAGMAGAIELLAEDLREQPRQLEIAAQLRHQLARLTQTMESMLGFARRPRVALQPVGVNRSVDKTLFVISQQIRKLHADITVERELTDELPPSFADPPQLEQALLNIALNAVQAMTERGGTLTVRTYERGDRVVVEIADTGAGIPEHVQRRIFEPYFTTKDSGTGLGLVMAARIVADHGGVIDYECPPTGGTIFRIALQTARSPGRRHTETQPPEPRGAAA